MNHWSTKRRRWHNADEHRDWLLRWHITRCIAEDLKRELERAILYGSNNIDWTGTMYPSIIRRHVTVTNESVLPSFIKAELNKKYGKENNHGSGS